MKESDGLLSIDNGSDRVIDADATLIAREYYTDYAKYVLEYRALPSVYDGLKPVQRRIIFTANQQPKKLMKTAKLAGLVLAYHPHSSDSVTGSIYNMAYPLNNFPLFTTKGNFGGVNAPGAASRYTECYLSEAARLNFCQFIDYAEYTPGEIGENEPVALPCLIPYALIEGSEGIAIGLSTKVMPMNLLDLIDFYIDFIKKDGKSKKTVKPDFGHVLVENSDLKEVVSSWRGRVTTSSIVTQISDNTFLVEGLYGRSIDAVIKKLDRYDSCFTKGQVGFRDASTTSMKYVFEIYDDKYPPEVFKENLEWATRSNTTFSRVMEEQGSAVYSTFEYVVRSSLKCLNSAIDHKINYDLERIKSQVEMYQVLEFCKKLHLFDEITSITTEDLVLRIVATSDCSQELAREIVKKPISYLTKSHEEEIEKLKSQLTQLKDHDRKKYLISLYKEFRKSVLPIYESRKHTISSSDLISNTCIKYENGVASVTDGEGLPFKLYVYFISDKGYVYRRSVSSSTATDFVVDTCNDDKIVGFVTDASSFVLIKTRFNYEGWSGRSVIDLSTISKDKRVVNLRDSDGEEVIDVIGLSSLSDDMAEYLKSRLSRTSFVKET